MLATVTCLGTGGILSAWGEAPRWDDWLPWLIPAARQLGTETFVCLRWSATVRWLAAVAHVCSPLVGYGDSCLLEVKRHREVTGCRDLYLQPARRLCSVTYIPCARSFSCSYLMESQCAWQSGLLVFSCPLRTVGSIITLNLIKNSLVAVGGEGGDQRDKQFLAGSLYA
jgi:hypothetical protein